MQQGRAPVGLRQFEAALEENPNRYDGLYGAGRAAETAGARAKAFIATR